MKPLDIAELITRQKTGWSLEQPFYTSKEIYEFECQDWLAKQWHILAHCSEVPEVGSFIVRELLGESLLITRDEQGALRGFYNVCRHRGSRICDQDGRGKGFTCPYHGWSYRLDGTLRAAAALPDGIEVSQLGLRTVPVREIGGMILGSLRGDLSSLDAVQRELEPGLKFHGITQARIAARRCYPTYGNWKLVLENARECYHCYPAHPEYCSVMQWVDAIARVPTDGGVGWAQTVAKWFSEEADPESPIKTATWLKEEADGDVALNLPRAPLTSTTCGASRVPIGGGRKTQSQDGKPVAPLMGQISGFDGGVSLFVLRPFVSLMALNDHAVMFQFLPTGPESTDVILTWLVDASARDQDVDVPRMIWLWDVTTVQDKHIIERNASGVRSQSYSPGPYSKVEAPAAQLVESYLKAQLVLASGK